MAKSKSQFNSRTRKIILLIIAVLIIAAAVLVFVKRDAISEKFANRGPSVSYAGDPYSFESGSQQVSGPVGNGLALASANGLQLLDSSGKTVAREVYSMRTPALAVCSKCAVAFDVGGTQVAVADLNGNCREITTENKIVNVTVNKNGWLAVTTEAPGYKGKVTVYNASLNPAYEWSSGESYVVSAEVSPDDKYMAVLTVAESGGGVHIFSLSSETEQASYVSAGELFIDLHWMESNRICLLSQNRCVLVDRSGQEKGSYGFNGLYLTDYSFGGDGFAVLMLGKYRTGGTGTLLSIGPDGKLLGQTEISSEIESICANGKLVAALCQDSVKLFTQSMSQTGYGENVAGVKNAVVRDKGDVLLVSSYYAEIRVL